MKSIHWVISIVGVLFLMLGSAWAGSSARGLDAQNPGNQVLADVGTAFTFQGQLTFNSRPVNDQCLMRFSLFNAATGGAQVGSAFIPPAAVPVVNGLFAIELDFGDVFDNTALWLESEVKCTGDAAYVNLGRQRLTATPQAGNARRLDGNPSAFYRNAGNLNAGMLPTDRFSAQADLAAEGYLGDAAGDLAQNNGTLQTNLNADVLDGMHGSTFEQSVMEGTVTAGTSTIIEIPNWYPFTLQLGSGWPDTGGVAFVTGMENDRSIAITYIAYNGDGTSQSGGAECSENSTTTLLTFGSGNYTYQVKCPGEAAGAHNLVLSANALGVELRYKLVY